MINLLKLLPWIAFIIGDALYDFFEIKKGERPWYFKEWFIRAMVAFANWFLWRRKPALYVGLNSGWFDPYFAKHPVNHVIAKAAALALMVLSTIGIYYK
jgi:membrane-associated phospholipid phosphatase